MPAICLQSGWMSKNSLSNCSDVCYINGMELGLNRQKAVKLPYQKKEMAAPPTAWEPITADDGKLIIDTASIAISFQNADCQMTTLKQENITIILIDVLNAEPYYDRSEVKSIGYAFVLFVQVIILSIIDSVQNYGVFCNILALKQ